jgi:GDP-D-mannose dehydratase
VRLVETPVLRGDPSLIEQHTGWRARTPIEHTLADMLEYFVHAAV